MGISQVLSSSYLQRRGHRCETVVPPSPTFPRASFAIGGTFWYYLDNCPYSSPHTHTHTKPAPQCLPYELKLGQQDYFGKVRT